MTPPTRYALVPIDLTPEMDAALDDFEGECVRETTQKAWEEFIATASPNGGCVSAADLERAAIVAAGGERSWNLLLTGKRRKERLKEHRMFLTALGLPVADAPAGEVVDG